MRATEFAMPKDAAFNAKATHVIFSANEFAKTDVVNTAIEAMAENTEGVTM